MIISRWISWELGLICSVYSSPSRCGSIQTLLVLRQYGQLPPKRGKSSLILSSIAESCQILTDLSRSCHIWPNVAKSSQIMSSSEKSCRIAPKLVNSSQIQSNTVQFRQFSPNIPKYGLLDSYASHISKHPTCKSLVSPILVSGISKRNQLSFKARTLLLDPMLAQSWQILPNIGKSWEISQNRPTLA